MYVWCAYTACMYWTTGKGRFEFTIQTDHWGLPFGLDLGRGGHVFRVLCFEFTYWRGTNRFTRYDD
jgi:hypothetical protein